MRYKRVKEHLLPGLSDQKVPHALTNIKFLNIGEKSGYTCSPAVDNLKWPAHLPAILQQMNHQLKHA